MIELGVNIDHVATLRQARRTYEPDPLWAAVEAHLGGADGITVHLREDRRHIQDEDVRRLREIVNIKLNLEMAATAEMLDIALRLKPEMAMFVPEGRHEITTEGGLDVASQEDKIKDKPKDDQGDKVKEDAKKKEEEAKKKQDDEEAKKKKEEQDKQKEKDKDRQGDKVDQDGELLPPPNTEDA